MPSNPLASNGAIVQVHLRISHRLGIEAKSDSLYTILTRGAFHKGYMPLISFEN
jgi:hypothetical protein